MCVVIEAVAHFVVCHGTADVSDKSIFHLDKLFFPHHVFNHDHWATVVVDMKERTVTYYCSMGRKGLYILKMVFRYLKQKHRDLFGVRLPNIAGWKLVECPIETPLQRNLDGVGLGVDCGVFMCMFIDRIMQNAPNLYCQEHMVSYRELICTSILSNQIHIWDGDECDTYIIVKFS